MSGRYYAWKYKSTFDSRMFPLTDEEKMDAWKMTAEITEMVAEVTDKQNEYKKSYRRMKADNVRRINNPIACSKCMICSTCMKRVQHGLKKCPFGILKKVKKAA